MNSNDSKDYRPGDIILTSTFISEHDHITDEMSNKRIYIKEKLDDNVERALEFHMILYIDLVGLIARKIV
jgi:hypothetical protein